MSASVPDTCVFVRVHASVFVYIRVIKSPDAAARIISDASGRVFRSRTFETHYMFFPVFSFFTLLVSSSVSKAQAMDVSASGSVEETSERSPGVCLSLW